MSHRDYAMDHLDRTGFKPCNVAALRRLALSAAEEAAATWRPDANPPALAEFADLFVHSVLRGLERDRSGLAPACGSGPAPGYLRRAEAYLRDHADRPVLMRDVAAAAGCSLRALQLTFRRFRETTPNAALRRVRLDRAREELARDGEPLAAIARRFGFSNTGRFVAAYARRFGETPAETRQKRRS